MELFLVGGAVRDEIMGIKSKDWDFSVVLDPADIEGTGLNPFAFMKYELLARGFEIFVETPEFFTLRARGPKGFTFAGMDFGNQTFDFVMARKESGYTDGRRPDMVEVGDLMDDLSRRDFGMNAIAKDSQGNLIDPFNGQQDIADKVIRAVGNPEDRIQEDALRIMRALRFSVTKGFRIDGELDFAISQNAELLRNVSTERIREELEKMFKVDTWKTIMLLTTHERFDMVGRVVFNLPGLRLMPTMKG